MLIKTPRGMGRKWALLAAERGRRAASGMLCCVLRASRCPLGLPEREVLQVGKLRQQRAARGAFVAQGLVKE